MRFSERLAPAPRSRASTLRRAGACVLAFCIAGLVGYVVAGPTAITVTDRDNPHATKVERHHSPTRVLFPAQEIPLYFSHAKHIAQEIECLTCHESVEGSMRSADVNLPGGDACAVCHDVSEPNPAQADPPAACSTCHLGYAGKYEGFDPHSEPERVAAPPARVRIPEPHLSFNHKAHVTRGVACTQCHAHLDRVDVAVVENALPVMGDCMGCHNGKEAPRACTTCHQGVPTADARIQTSYPEGQLKPHGYYRNDAHNDAFVMNHAQVAREDEGYCASCHAPQFCVDCHNGVVKPLNIHPANWLLVHPTTARKNSQECTSCHREQSFCLDCHKRSGLVDLTSNLDTSLAFHPAGWVNAPGEPPAGSHHMFEAQRNIRACVSCHQEQTCLKCHSARDPVGFGVQRARRVSPHPPDFRSRCRVMAKLNDHVCGKCHDSNDPNLLLCR